MSSFPFPNSSNKWIGIPEAKHPLIQDLIRLWEECPGYILPQNSFIKDRAKLESFIDALVENQKQKAQTPAKPPVVMAKSPVLNTPIKSEAATKGQDAAWEKNLMSALAMNRMESKGPQDSKLPAIPEFPDLAKIPGVADKLADLKALDNIALEPKKIAPTPMNIHILILYGLSLSAFMISIFLLKARFF